MTDTPITDDYVAEILKRDAQRTNQTRSVVSGLGSLLSRRPRVNAPKPNTRFLRNIVRDADAHNAALRKKEEDESRARLRRLQRHEASSSSSSRHRERSPSGNNHRRRRAGLSPREKAPRHSEDRAARSREERRSRDRRRSRSPRRSDGRSRHERRRDSHSRERTQKFSREEESDGSSDPLESAIGPRPPLPGPSAVAFRGRGANNGSAMDSRFQPDYDPKLDVSLHADDRAVGDSDDWDMALEALRDRTRWRKSGAERLRAAGFTDDEVAKWEAGGGGGGVGRGDEGEEKDIAAVKWRKKGEAREWDRGKVVDGGRLDVKAEWARAKER